MKKTVLVILVLLAAFSSIRVNAQGKYGADSTTCIKYLSYYKEYFKQKNYDEALPNWREAYKYCPPTANQALLLDGTTLIRREITKNAKNEAYKNALVDTLLTLHQQRAEYYPKYATVALNNKGLDMATYIKDNPQALYDGFKTIVEANGNDVKPQILLFELNAAIDLFRDSKLGADDIISIYQNNMSVLGCKTPANDLEKSQIDKIKTDMESLFITSKVASCENLIELFTPRYQADPNNLELATNIVKMMGTAEDCTDNDLFLQAVTTMYKMDPSYTSAYYLYRLNASRGNSKDAVKYLEEAIAAPESDSATDGEYCYELAAYCVKNGMQAKAFEAASKVPSLNPEYTGKAYFLIGTIWGSTVCRGNEIESRAPYWVAVDYMQKAKTADDSLTDEANKFIGMYAKYFPQTAEAFMYDVTDGQSYTVSCNGMRATTVVRTQK